MLDSLVELARAEGIEWLIGEYLPTARNGMVAGHYESLGFEPIGAIEATQRSDDGRQATRWRLPVARYRGKPVQMTIRLEGLRATDIPQGD